MINLFLLIPTILLIVCLFCKPKVQIYFVIIFFSLIFALFFVTQFLDIGYAENSIQQGLIETGLGIWYDAYTPLMTQVLENVSVELKPLETEKLDFFPYKTTLLQIYENKFFQGAYYEQIQSLCKTEKITHIQINNETYTCTV